MVYYFAFAVFCMIFNCLIAFGFCLLGSHIRHCRENNLNPVQEMPHLRQLLQFGKQNVREKDDDDLDYYNM